MIWGGRNPESERSRAMIEALTEAGRHKHVAHLLGFNEPDSDSQANLSVEQELAFMKEILPALDRLEFVERYAWFPADETSAPLSPSALFHEDGSLTTLGRYYAKH